MSLQTRLEKMERVLNAGDDGEVCGCYRQRDIRVYSDENSIQDAENDTRPAAMCELCGRPKHVVKIVVVRTREEATQ